MGSATGTRTGARRGGVVKRTHCVKKDTHQGRRISGAKRPKAEDEEPPTAGLRLRAHGRAGGSGWDAGTWLSR